MREIYEDLGAKMGRFRCVSIKNAPKEPYFDFALSGERGEIYPKGDGSYKAFFVLPGGSEKIISFKSEDLEKWILRLKVPPNPADQLFWANNPNARHTSKKGKK